MKTREEPGTIWIRRLSRTRRRVMLIASTLDSQEAVADADVAADVFVRQ